MMSVPIYDTFARVYDLQHRAFADDVPMYLHLAREFARDCAPHARASLLEIGCGTGRLMGPLVEAGFHVTGVDESQAMLDIAAARLRNLSGAFGASSATAGTYDLLRADARTLALGAKFELAYIPLNTFLHNLTRDDQLRMLRAVRRHLRDGAPVVVDLPPNDEMAYQPDDGEFQFEATLIEPQAGSELSKFVASRIFWATQEQELTYKVEERRAGVVTDTITFGFRLRHVFKHEMELLLLDAGFGTPRWLGDYDLNAYVEGSPRMIVVAKAALPPASKGEHVVSP